MPIDIKSIEELKSELIQIENTAANKKEISIKVTVNDTAAGD